MKIYALCLAKNEIDIIEQTLTSAAQWCDFIYVFDNGSSDGTWEKILELGDKYPQIVPYKQDDCPFSENLGGQIFNHYRANCIDGDWWCRLDADEIYIDNPREFITKVPPKYKAIVTAVFNYYFTDRDLELYESNPALYADDVPVAKKCRYYLNNWSELRFFEYSSSLIWESDRQWPSGLTGDAYPVRIRQKNFQYRSPQQIEKRLEIRRAAAARNSFPHESQSDWKKMVFNNHLAPANVDYDRADTQTWKDRILEASALDYDADDGNYILREQLMPNLYTMSLIWDYRSNLNNLSKRIFRKVNTLVK
jgi:glycosyltransferase involved in cell wall biosynthesis